MRNIVENTWYIIVDILSNKKSHVKSDVRGNLKKKSKSFFNVKNPLYKYE